MTRCVLHLQDLDEIAQDCDNLVWQCCSQPCDKVIENTVSEIKLNTTMNIGTCLKVTYTILYGR